MGLEDVISQANKFEPYPEGSGQPSKDFKQECDMISFAFLKDHSGYIVDKRLECWLDQRQGEQLGCGSNLGWKR